MKKKKGEMLFNKGDFCEQFYIIVEGQVEIFKEENQCCNSLKPSKKVYLKKG